MSKAELDLVGASTQEAAPALQSASGTPVQASELETSHRNALQALLAFSSLHNQILQRRTRDARGNTAPGEEEDWFQTEQFILDEVLQLVAERALAITGADGVAIALAEGEQIICRGSAGTIAPDAGMKLDPNSGFSGACFRAGKVIRCDDVENDDRVNLQACQKLGARSMVAVPLCGKDAIVGLVQAFSRDAFAFNDSDIRSLNLLAELILAALKPEEEDQLLRAAKAASAEIREPVVLESAKPAPESLRVAEELFEPPEAPSTLPAFDEPLPLTTHKGDSSRPGLVLVIAVVIIAGLLAGGLWWRIQNASNVAAKASTREKSSEPAASVAATPSPADSSPPASDSAASPAPVDESALSEAAKQKLAVLPHITGIRHWSTANASTVAIDLQDQVQYEAHRLTSPERIYFDLHDTALDPGLAGRAIEIGDVLLTRVRVAQPMVGVTRIVLETNGASNFSVSMETNPYRLVVEIRGVESSQARSRVNLFPSLHDPQQKQAAVAPQPGDAEDAKLRARVPKFRVVVDAGHGGWDLGTVGRQGLLEKDLVLDVAERVGELLASRLGTEVLYTRKDDTYISLEQRADLANQAQADVFVSIHANYSDLLSARGVETYYTNFFSPPGSREIEKRENGDLQKTAVLPVLSHTELHDKVEESRRLATSVQRSLFHTLAGQSPSIRNRGVKEASFVVLTGTAMPAILAEISFVSSPTDEHNLQRPSYRQQIAEALYKGIARYAASSHRVKMASASPRQTGE